MKVSADKKATTDRLWPHSRLAFAAALLLIEAILLVFVYRFDLAGLIERPADTSFCLAALGSQPACTSLSKAPGMILLFAIIAGFVRLLAPERVSVSEFAAKVSSFEQPNAWLVFNVLGFALILLPYFLTRTDISSGAVSVVVLLSWLTGTIAFVSGLLLWLLPAREIRNLLNWKVIAVILGLSALPQLDVFVGETLWVESFLQDATIRLTSTFLRLFGQPVLWDGGIILGIDKFVVSIASSCAGVSGIAFSSSAMAAYIIWMRKELNVKRAIAVLPLVAALSWTFNALRIAILMMIGEYISPDLAVDGFHSYAGWISFTLLTGALIFAVDRIPWFQKGGARKTAIRKPSLFEDQISAQILPFTVFLFSSLVVGALFEVPAVGYPYRVLVTLAVLLAFARCIPAGVSWRLDPLAVFAGAAIAAMWLAGQWGESAALADIVPGLTGTALLVWIVARLFGTTILVPVIEEVFFRGYLLNRLNFGGRYGTAIALIASSALFAMLHGNIVLAFVAGLVFGALVLRSGRVWDAVVAHAVANGLIGLYALVMDNWAVI
ncbi:exosortase E/protease, VPEID-CTERM system [Sulfitobacter sp. JL08]|uniref:exosortase E/protease, VPEID-CTERM system n=1 Tax=Sulfitobacter sp. JL08 TaxID=2070369 RepID=UPI0013B36889|nr:exosortase E/protease, VPEID-CTERM system [Sulfitobacter sp. JL08]